ncbi:hypothetical protein [Lapidilactobacillus gannanensis]|jgi:hypothetical protein|uniref:Clp protease n=1 Tax=Lapidilactobacillus gannanensis TaxID=2486002 RepID=A0ABW4BPQ4_9LACO|nr:hypothetical protein [Lapidilactobacillus gannanensis]MCH4056908.1 hypothetical protein [Lactobacillaceae bacterium]
MEKIFNTRCNFTKGLLIVPEPTKIFPPDIPVKAKVDLATGAVTLFVAPEDLPKLKGSDLKFSS